MFLVDDVIVVALLFLAYVWVGYPILLALVARKRVKPATGMADKDRITIIVSAYNEERRIKARIENIIATTRRFAKCEVLAGVDGATDRTADLAKEASAAHKEIKVVEFSTRSGKVVVLKRLVSMSQGEILVFTDANTVFMPDAVEKLLSHFADPRVGGVCGRLVLGVQSAERMAQKAVSAAPESVYWLGETRLKEAESAMDSCLGANGAIYAIRAGLFPHDIPDNVIVDDFVIGMKVREQGFRMVFEPQAIAYEDLPSESDEWRRRVRIGAGDYQALGLCWKCLSPSFGLFAWMFWSHKVLRWFTPHLVLILIGACLVQVVSGGEGSMFRMQNGGWILAGLAIFLMLSLAGCRVRMLAVFRHFVVMQAALFAGFIRFCRGNLRGTWERTPRQGDNSH